jgi:hypothetical protein
MDAIALNGVKIGANRSPLRLLPFVGGTPVTMLACRPCSCRTPLDVCSVHTRRQPSRPDVDQNGKLLSNPVGQLRLDPSVAGGRLPPPDPPLHHGARRE